MNSIIFLFALLDGIMFCMLFLFYRWHQDFIKFEMTFLDECADEDEDTSDDWKKL